MTLTDGHVDDGTCMSSGGLVDRQTAAAEDVLLWSDPASADVIAAAVTPMRLRAVA